MAELIKNRYNYESLSKVALDIKSVYSLFTADEFLESIFDETWDRLELKNRLRQIGLNLGKYLPPNYEEAIGILDKVVMNYGSWLDGFGGFFPVFVEIYGQNERDWDVSMSALERYTQYASSELAVRSFIIQNEKRMMEQMTLWSKSENEHARRLSSEGCRPVLPWGQALNSFKKDPSPILPILEQLKTDPCVSVQKSVANNLNDISKTHPELVIKIAQDWYGKNKTTDWIVKHGCRTLLKKGCPEVLKLFGYDNAKAVAIDDFALAAPSIFIGEDLSFSFTASVTASTKVRMEYAIDYVKSRGNRSRKIFQISEITFKENEQRRYTKKQSFADVCVRKHYPGTHSITLIVNGTERGTLDFELYCR